MVLAGDHQGTMLGERGLEKETHIEKEKMCDNEKLKNRDNIIFLLLLDIGQKVIRI